MTHYTTNEAADRLGVKPITIRKAIRQGRLSAGKFGHVWMVREDKKFRLFTPGTPGRPRHTPQKPVPANPVILSASDHADTSLLRVDRYRGGPYFALYEGDALVCVTVYRKGTEAVRQRLMQDSAAA